MCTASEDLGHHAVELSGESGKHGHSVPAVSRIAESGIGSNCTAPQPSSASIALRRTAISAAWRSCGTGNAFTNNESKRSTLVG